MVDYEEEYYLLYNSQICRLCCVENANGSPLYTGKEDDVTSLINTYLPLKIAEDGKYPRWICPGCHLQVEATVEFFDLVINGQESLRALYKAQQLRILDTENNALEAAILPESTIVAEADDLFKSDHDLRYQMAGLEKPKRKRGRPPKPAPEVLKAQELAAAEDEARKLEEKLIEASAEEDSEGRKKRRIKIPLRFQEVVQGKELERIYVEKGVIDKSESLSDDDYTQMQDTDVIDYSDDIIGHLQDTDGTTVADLIFENNKYRLNRKTLYGKKRKTKFMCDVCNRGFISESRYLAHRATHHNVRYECTQCITQFLQRAQLCEHQKATGHMGEGIIESLEECDDKLPETHLDDLITSVEVPEFHVQQDELCEELPHIKPDQQIIQQEQDMDNNNSSTDVFSQIDDVVDDITHIEEAAKVLYGLQNIDKIDSNQQMIIEPSTEYLKHDFIEYNPSSSELPITAVQNSLTSEVPVVQNVVNSISEKLTFPTSLTIKKAERIDCSKCNKTFHSDAQLQIHFQLIHEGGESYQLLNEKITQKVTNKQSDELKYACDKCDRVFKTPSSVVYHKESEHNSGRRFVCSKCGKSFKHKQLLQRHQLVHTDDRPYPCEICGASFKTKPNLLNHLPKHSGVKKHECSMCNQSFAHKTSLKLHYRWHSGSKPFECTECGKSFTQNGNLQEHMRIHTGERPYNCAHCDKKFKTSSQCRIHMKRHINYKPFECNVCSKTFLHFEIYRTHLRRHNNEKPFACGYCPKSFSEQWALRKHTRVHTGEKPYRCPVCFKAFADCSNLKKHKKTHDVSKTDTFEESKTKIENNKMDNTEISSISCIQNDGIATTPTIPEGAVWKLLNNSNLVVGAAPPDPNNQVIYVTYQDPNDPSGNKTLQVLSHLNGNEFTTIGLDTNEALENKLDQHLITNQNIGDDNIDYNGDVDDYIDHEAEPTLPVSEAAAASPHIQYTISEISDGYRNEMHLDGTNSSTLQFNGTDDLPRYQLADDKVMLKLETDNDQDGLFDENGQAIEFITSDGRKLRLLTHYSEPLDLSADFNLISS